MSFDEYRLKSADKQIWKKWGGAWDIDFIGPLFWVGPDPNLQTFSWHADKGYP